MDECTNEEIAESYALWLEYVDPDVTTAEEEFNAMPY